MYPLAATRKGYVPARGTVRMPRRAPVDARWIMVIAVAAALLAIPAVIYGLPTLLGTAGVPYIVALLILPLAPAVALAVAAVYYTTPPAKLFE